MQIIYLTQTLDEDTYVYPGDPKVKVDQIQTFEKDGWNMKRIHMNGHDGTHVNVPIHASMSGDNLDDYALEHFIGPAEVYRDDSVMNSETGYIFRDHDITEAIAEKIKAAKPKFIALSDNFEFDETIEKDLLQNGIISFERLTNTDTLPDSFVFYGAPLKISEGDGSPVRAFAIV